MQNKRLRRRVAALEKQVQGLLEIVEQMHPAKVQKLHEIRTQLLTDDDQEGSDDARA